MTAHKVKCWGSDTSSPYFKALAKHRQVIASGRKLNFRRDLRWVAKRTPNFPRKNTVSQSDLLLETRLPKGLYTRLTNRAVRARSRLGDQNLSSRDEITAVADIVDFIMIIGLLFWRQFKVDYVIRADWLMGMFIRLWTGGRGG